MAEVVINYKNVEIQSLYDQGKAKWRISSVEVLHLTGDDKPRTFDSLRHARQWVDQMLGGLL